MTWILGFALVAGLLTLAARSGVVERFFIYFPDRELEANPTARGLEFEDVFFRSDDGVRLHGWFVSGSRNVTWLWFHGNAGNISHRLENMRLLRDELGVSVFLFDYRGYGRSEGTPSEEGTYRDAEAALAYLRDQDGVHRDRVVYFGRSLGAAVAVHLATRHPPYALILESPFPSIPYMARRAYPFLPVWPLLRTRYDSQEKMAHVKAPLLVLHGDADDTVPLEGARMLFDAANQPKEFQVIPGAGHNDTYVVGGRSYFAALRGFLEELDE